jgi:regulator of protease activity HflC (stomatin/prohibitin superfamily)
MKTASKRKHGQDWTPAEVRRLRALARRKLPARVAATVLGRTHGAVKFKAMVEGVRFHAIEQPRGVQRRPAQRRKLARLRRARAA